MLDMKMTFNIDESIDHRKMLRVRVISESGDKELMTAHILYGNYDNLTVCKNVNELNTKYIGGHVNNSSYKNISNMTDKEVDCYIDDMIKHMKNLINDFDEYTKNVRKMTTRPQIYTSDWKLII